jgi:hypothetical protein
MIALLSFILTIVYVIWLGRLISFGVRTATRIAVATEATAASMALIVSRLPPPPLPASDIGYDAVERELAQ